MSVTRFFLLAFFYVPFAVFAQLPRLVLPAGHTDIINSVHFSHDGKLVLTSSKDKTAKLWDCKTGYLLQTLYGHSSFLVDAQFDPSGRYILTGSFDHTLKLWSLADGKLIRTYEGHEAQISDFQLSGDGKYIASVAYDSTARLWNLETGECLKVLRGFEHWLVDQVSIEPGDQTIIASGWDSQNISWNRETGEVLKKWKKDSSFRERHFAISPDGKKLAMPGDDKEVKLLNLPDSSLHAILGQDKLPLLKTASFDPSGQLMGVAFGGDIQIWNAVSGKLEKNFTIASTQILSIDFSPDWKKILVRLDRYPGQTANWLFLLDATDGKIIARFRGHSNLVFSSHFSPDGKKIVTASIDSTCRVWDAGNGKLISQIKIESPLYDAYFDPSGEKLLIAGQDEYPQLRSITGGELLHNFSMGLNASIDPTGNIIYTSGLHKEDTIGFSWDATTGKLRHTLVIPRRVTSPMQGYFSPDSKFLAVKVQDEGLFLFTTADGKLVGEIKDVHIGTASFSPDGKYILSTDRDNTIRLWNINTLSAVYTFNSFGNESFLKKLPDGYYMCNIGAAANLYYVNDKLDIIRFEQLDVRFNRPDKVLEAIGRSDSLLILSYRLAWEKRIKLLKIDTSGMGDMGNFPVADIVNRDELETEQKNSKVALQVHARDSMVALKNFNAWVNEVPLFGKQGISINNHLFDTTITITLSVGENKIETAVTNVKGVESFKSPVLLNYDPVVQPNERVYFIGIGIDKFKDPAFNLQFSVKDIRDLAASLKKRYGKAFFLDTLLNQRVTVGNIRALKSKLLQMDENDKVIIAYSGHGLLNNQFDYFLSTYEVNFENPGEGGLPYELLEELVDQIRPRKKLLLIDACHSGEVDKEDITRIKGSSPSLIKGLEPVAYNTDRKQLGLLNSFELMQNIFVNAGKHTGSTIISAAAGTQFALERGDLRNGVFTYAILELLRPGERLRISDLQKKVSARVESLTKGLQRPTSRASTISFDWIL